ncbi:MAG: Calx-beta domain-containing protein, partial [Fibrobacterota bacterium]
YQAVSGATGTIRKGRQDTTITVLVNGDRRFESDEAFQVVLDSASLVGRIASSGWNRYVNNGTILNDDGRPMVVMKDTAFAEGDADIVRKLRVFLADSTGVVLDLASAPQMDIGYNWRSDDITATAADNDYIMTGSFVPRTIKAGTIRDTITLTTKGDVRFEPDETFKVILTPGTNAFPYPIGYYVDTVKLLNDDNQPVVEVRADSSIHEGSRGQRKVATFTIRLKSQADGHLLTASELPSSPVSFDWSTIDGIAIGMRSGSSDSDFIPVTKAHKTIALGKSTDTLQVAMVGDNRYETDETFSVQLFNLANTAPYGRNDTVTSIAILNDDSLPRLKITSDSVVHEGAPKDRRPSTFTVRLLDPLRPTDTLSLADAPEVPVRFGWNTVDSTAKTTAAGVADSDYVSKADSGVFAPGTLKLSLAVAIKGDNIQEATEVFRVVLTPRANASTSGVFSATGTILDDDAPPEFFLTGVRAAEGNTGTNPSFNFGIKLSNFSALPISFQWSTRDSTAKVADADYQAKSSVSATIPAGLDTFSLPVVVNGDNRLENDEVFSIKLSALTNGATFHGNKDTAVGVILNDDAKPYIQVQAANPILERNSGTPDTLRFPIRLVDSNGLPLTAASALDVTYTWSTVDSAGVNGASST